MSYQSAIRDSMTMLAQDPLRLFIGYNVCKPNSAGGALADVPESQIVEMPVAENLIVSAAIGLALEGFKPVAWIERMDFLLNAMDAIANHLDKLPDISDGEFAPKVIIRTMTGSTTKPLYSGPTHCTDYTEAFRRMVNFSVYSPISESAVKLAYQMANKLSEPCIVVEHRDCHE